MKIAIVVGTRPEIIKMSPIVRECQNRGLDFYMVHTGQHYSYNMDQVFFEQLELPQPQYQLDVGSGLHGEQTGKILTRIEAVFEKDRPDVVLVEGDTNSVLGGALAAKKLHILVGHVEAGLRSFDRSMPEEINRVLTDHCADLLFAPTEVSKENLLHEGIKADTIFVTGNTIVDAVLQNRILAAKRASIIDEFDLRLKNFFLVTSHRQENVDVKDRFSGIIQGLKQIYDIYNIPVVYPIHPRAQKKLEEFELDMGPITVVDPVDYFQFLQLEEHARLVLTDSGGVQEETAILGTPCVTLRDNTERPETLSVSSNMLAGTHPERIVEKVSLMMQKDNSWVNPFGVGDAGKQIVRILEGS